jgi:hypothetical protein
MESETFSTVEKPPKRRVFRSKSTDFADSVDFASAFFLFARRTSSEPDERDAAPFRPNAPPYIN